MLKINHNSPIPLYYQLRTQIRDNIVSEKWEYGKEIPSEAALCEEFDLSRATVKQAMDELVRDGLIERKRGKGTFVIYKKESLNAFSDPSLSIQLRSLGVDIHSRVLLATEGEAPSDVCGFFDGETSFAIIHRIRYVNGKPFAIDETYIKREWASKILRQNLTSLSIYEYIERINSIRIDGCHISICPILFGSQEKQLLDLEDSRVGILVTTRPIIGIRLDMTSTYKDDVIMLTRRRLNSQNVSISADYSAEKGQLTMASCKLIIPEE